MSYLLNRDRLMSAAGCLAIAVAVSLPWSTSATSILIVLWLFALVPTLRWADIRIELMTAAGGLPVLLVLLGALGMLWADVPWIERFGGVESFLKLLTIPLLFAQFRLSDRGIWVFVGYLASCLLLLVVSTIVEAFPALSHSLMHYDSVLVKNAATQSGEFVTCIFGLLYFVIGAFEQRRWWSLFAMVAVIFGMLASIFYVAAGRTALVIIPVLVVVLALKRLNARGVFVLFAGAILVGTLGWNSSTYLRERITLVWVEYKKYEATDARNSSGERVEFWKKSVGFVRLAPIFGQGTGSIHSLFVESAVGRSGAAASDTTNPHNQTFAVAIQLGLLGAVVLWAMWIAHILLFRGNGLAEWIGLIVVVQNIIGSLFNSHLFDFGQGWVYVFGVGIAGGMALRNRRLEKLADD